MKLCFPVLPESEVQTILASLDISYDFGDPSAYCMYARILSLLNVPDSGHESTVPAAQAAEHAISCALTRVQHCMGRIIAIASKRALSFTIYDVVDARPARTRIFLSAAFNFIRFYEFYRKLIKEMHAHRYDRFATLQMLAKERRVVLEHFNYQYFQFMDSKPLIEKTDYALAETRAEVDKMVERYRDLSTQYVELEARKGSLEGYISELQHSIDQELHEMKSVAPVHRSLAYQYQFGIIKAQSESYICKIAIKQLSERIDYYLQNHNIMREIYRATQANKQQRAELARLQKTASDAQIYRIETDVRRLYSQLEKTQGSASEGQEAQYGCAFVDYTDEGTMTSVQSAVTELEASLAREEETKRELEMKRKAVHIKAEQLQSQACERFNEYFKLFIAQMQASERLFFDFLEQEKKSMQSKK